jgi:hypothetical protein
MDSDTPLSDEQAIQAVRLFYDFSTPELWEEGEKPSPEFVEKIAAALVKQAPADLQPAVAALVGDNQPGHTAARAEVCRLLLRQLRQTPAFQPAVDRAIENARKPHMMIDPVTGTFIIAILIATAKNADGISKVISALDLPRLLHELPPVLKALPEGVLKALLQAHG